MFVVLSAVGLWQHEIWRDEAQSWLLARDSASLSALFYNARYEGHPLLWHVCLFALAKITSYPWIMKAFHWLVAGSSMILIIKTSPFSKLQKGLLSVSYFLFYEYCILSRNYAIGIFFLFLFCALYTQKKPKYWLLSVVLALSANANVFSLMISLSLGVLMLYRMLTEASDSEVRQSDSTPSVTRWRLRRYPTSQRPYAALARQVLPQVLVLGIGWSLSALQISRAVLDRSHKLATTGAPVNLDQAIIPEGLSSQIDELSKLAHLIVRSYWPFPQLRISFWNGHLLDSDNFPLIGSLSSSSLLAILIAAITVVVAIKALWKTPVYLCFYVVANSLAACFHSTVFRGDTRHYGHFFIILIVSLWLATWSRRQLGISPIEGRLATSRSAVVGSAILTTVLVFQSIAGIHAYTADLIYPFSASREVASYLQSHQLEDTILFSQDDRKATGIASYLNRSIYYPQRRAFGSFWDTAYPDLETSQAVTDSIAEFAENQPEFLVVLGDPIDPGIIANATGGNVTLLSKTEPTIQFDERFYLYEVARR